MGAAKDVRHFCQATRPAKLKDGTTCLCESPLPGTVDSEPSWMQNFGMGVDDPSKPLGQEAWFEHRYPNLLETSRLYYSDEIDSWIQDNWDDTQFKDQPNQRIVVIGQNIYNLPKNEKIIKDKGWVRDDVFAQCGGPFPDKVLRVGDQPQTFNESDIVVGRFWIDIETPIDIKYSTKKVRGIEVRTFEWTAVMYIGDVLGAQAGEPANLVNMIPGVDPLAPSRKVKRARWTIHGEGMNKNDDAMLKANPSMQAYTVVAGDTLSKLAKKFYGDEKLYPILYAANLKVIGSDPDKIEIGITLRVPSLNELTDDQKDRAMKSVPKRNDPPVTVQPQP